MPNQHPGFLAMPPGAATLSGAQVQSLQQTRVQGVSQANTGQGTRAGHQMPFNFHGAHPQAVMAIYPHPHHSGGPPRSFHFGHGVR